MQYNFPPLTIEQLKQKMLLKGMLIEDNTAANHSLLRYGYSRLIRYTDSFQIPEKEGYVFKPNTYLEDVTDIYAFDSSLRVTIFEAIAFIEVALRSAINATMTINKGTHWYLDKKNFDYKFTTTELDDNYRSNFEKFIEDVTTEFNMSKDRHIENYRNIYTDPALPPSWIVMEMVSFGVVCKLFSNIFEKAYKMEIASNFKTIPNIFESWLRGISHIRNQCAHHHKIIRQELKFPLVMPLREKNIFLAEHSKVNYKSIYAVICVIQYCIMSLKVPCLFKDNFIALIDNNPQIDLNELGFTPKWREEKIWQ